VPPTLPEADARPDPDQLLAQVQQAAETARRGKLRIFFGASAGVGKTYAMLESARAARAAGTDIVVGYVEPHGRAETERLLQGLERLPTLAVRYRGIVRQEFDLDAALRRHPVVLIVDEFAHSNLVEGDPPPRHEKRWQDVEELLNAGISVWTTVNVQHLESLNDVVAGITGVRQQETVPDHAFEAADEVELIDLPPEDLLARLRAGKVYLADQVATATQKFFRKENLTALREIALRKTADRVDAAMRVFEARGAAVRPWLARDRLIVAPGIDAQAEQVIRAGKRLADALDAEWTVLCVETPAMLKLSETQRNRRIGLLRLAESLGAEAVTLDGPSAAEVILGYARTRKATRIIVGSPKQRGWRALLRPSTVTELVPRAGSIDLISVGPGGSGSPAGPATPARTTRLAQAPPRTGIPWPRYMAAFATTLVATAIAWVMYPHFELTNLVMVYLLGAAVAGLRFGRGPAIVTCVASVAAFDFFFVPPRFSFAISDLQYLVTFAVMLVVAFAIASLTASVRQQTRIAGHRERRTAALYAMSRELSQTRGVGNMAAVAVRHVQDVFESRALVLLPGNDGRLHYPRDPGSQASLWRADMSVAQWVYHHNEPAGLGTDTLAGAEALYLPIRGSKLTFGVLAVLPTNPRRILLPEQRHLLETFAGQLALGLERALLAEESESARVAAESESLRRRLLTSIAHDLESPLEKIKHASVWLAEDGAVSGDQRIELARSIGVHADQLADVIGNSLELVRLEAGAAALRVEPHTVREIVTSVLAGLRPELATHPVSVQLPQDLPAVRADARLIEKVFENLLKNAARYTPAGTAVRIVGRAEGDRVYVVVEDDGPGLPSGDPALLFEPFQRGESSMPGAGLGLAICKTIVAAHGGTIAARNRDAGGAAFEFSLPAAPEGSTGDGQRASVSRVN
jgi:two-component system, OmpR family, sensor histidine kinase KdpD